MIPDPQTIENTAAAFTIELERVAEGAGRDRALLEAAGLLQGAVLTLMAMSDPGRLAYELSRLATHTEMAPFTNWPEGREIEAPPADQIAEAAHRSARVLRDVRVRQGRHIAIERASAAILASSRAIAALTDGGTAAMVLEGYAARAQAEAAADPSTAGVFH